MIAMALASCRECKNQVSEEAVACPRCGAPWPARPEWKGRGIDWKSKRTLWGYPLVHVAFGRDARGRLRVARGIIAIGQFAIGLVAVAQVGIGILFGFGQVMLGFTALAQVAIAGLFGVGQFATGYIAIGQVVAGVYGLAQTGIAEHMWSSARADPEAVEFFQELRRAAEGLLGRK